MCWQKMRKGFPCSHPVSKGVEKQDGRELNPLGKHPTTTVQKHENTNVINHEHIS